MTTSDTHRTIEAVSRIESARLIASLARFVHDVGLAEDLAQDTLLIALERWPETGIPDNPGAWLLATAKRRAIDMIRRNKLRDRKYEEIGRDMNDHHEPDFDLLVPGEVSDDLLRLIFMTCHPVLSREARVALTLRLLCGLTTDEIARAFMVQESTVAQRIVRAKKTLSATDVPFEVPYGSELNARMSSVLEVIYLVFNEGYSATSGGEWIRPMLCEEALRLGRILAELVPTDPEVHGLIALMEIQASRFKARVDSRGNLILLLDQNRALWDQLLIRRGLQALDRAEKLGGTYGPYRLQAEIAACHARARTSKETDWGRIAALYDALAQILPTPVVELNRAVALSMVYGPAVGLEAIDQLVSAPSLKEYYLLPSVRGDFLARLGRNDEAFLEFIRAASLTRNEREREFLLKRASEQKDSSN